jgi:hypothetical protein
MGKACERIAISDCVFQDYEERYEMKFTTLYDAIDDKRYFQNIGDKEYEKNRFILVGNESEDKGQLDAIKAVREISESGIADIELKMVGSYSDRFLWCFRRYIDKYDLKKNIKLIFFMDDLTEMRKESSYALVTSKFEALGRVTVEAMLSGCLVIGANTAGTLEMIGSEEERGILYNQGDVGSLVKSMLKAMSMPDTKKREKLYNAQKFAIEKFSPEAYTKSLLKVYERVVNKNVNFDKEKFLLSKRYIEHHKDVAENVPITCTSKRDRINEICRLWDETNEKYKVTNILKDKGIAKIIIYGMGKLGVRLYDECEENGVEILGVMDRDKYFLSEVVNVISEDDEIPMVDAIIVTSVSDNEHIRSALLKRTKVDVISIQQFLK